MAKTNRYCSAISVFDIQLCQTKVVKKTISALMACFDVPDVAYMAHMQGRRANWGRTRHICLWKIFQPFEPAHKIYRTDDDRNLAVLFVLHMKIRRFENIFLFRIQTRWFGGTLFYLFCILLAVSISTKDSLRSVLTSDLQTTFMPMVYSAPAKQDDINCWKGNIFRISQTLE